MSSQLLRLNTFRGEPASLGFEWHFTPNNQERQRVFQQALQGALGTLNSCSNNEFHLCTIGATIDMLLAMKVVTD